MVHVLKKNQVEIYQLSACTLKVESRIWRQDISPKVS